MFAFFLPNKSPFSYRTFVFSCLGVNFAFMIVAKVDEKVLVWGKMEKCIITWPHGDAVIVIAKQLDGVQVIKRRTANMSRKR